MLALSLAKHSLTFLTKHSIAKQSFATGRLCKHRKTVFLQFCNMIYLCICLQEIHNQRLCITYLLSQNSVFYYIKLGKNVYTPLRENSLLSKAQDIVIYGRRVFPLTFIWILRCHSITSTPYETIFCQSRGRS